jgi:TPR repeat protein
MKQTASLLDSAPTQNRNDPLWRSARAVYTLNQEVKPEELRIAMKELSQAASQGIIEATYWEAQIYMAEHSNTYNPAVGLQKLLHAAGRNHAHAALALGKVYSQGAKGIKRDIVKSKHYLEQARVLGLTESAELKKTLN